MYFNEEADLVKKISILAVDDDPNMQRLLNFYLPANIFSVITVSSGRLALHHLSNREFDLVISDIQMPEMDGIELVKEIRQRNQNIPIIVVSAFGKLSQEQKILKVGANTILEKPFEQDKLIETINNLLIKISI